MPFRLLARNCFNACSLISKGRLAVWGGRQGHVGQVQGSHLVAVFQQFSGFGGKGVAPQSSAISG